MKKTGWIRGLALVLALVLLVTAVGALNYDWSGDGKTNVWDLQLGINDNKTEEEQAAALKEALGGGDELKPNAQGEYEIYTSLGLYNMANMTNDGTEGGKTFRLMRDIDMDGAVWYTPDVFAGVLEADGHVISNLTIVGERKLSSSAVCAGFFSKIGRAGAVRNLKLENANLVLSADSEANFIGLIAGSVVGEISNCTTIGSVTDPRTSLTSTVYIGTICGRVENIPDNPAVGITVTDESILMTAETAEITKISGKSQKVLCKMGMDFAALSYPEGTESGKQYKRQLGIAGWAPNYDNFKKYNWQDISGACTVAGGTGKVYDLVDPILTARRQATVDKMYEICTVAWTPAQDMIMNYYKIGTGENAGKLTYSRKIWKVGTTYYGLPYNHGSGSLERFNAYTEEGSNGVRKVSSSLPAYAFYYTHSSVLEAMNTNGENATVADANFPYWKQGDVTKVLIDAGLVTGDKKFNLSNGTYYENIVHQLGLGYQSQYAGEATLYGTVKSADHAGWCAYLGNDCSQAIMWAWREVVSSDVKNGGTVISGVSQMCPTTANQKNYGLVPVGGMEPTKFDPATIDEIYSALGSQGFMNLYAQASRGDALICDQTAGAHSRMIAYDPICIRNYRGTIDGANSYLITHEQGGSAKNEYTTCHPDRVLAFNSTALIDDDDHKNKNEDGKGVSCSHYFPVSIKAFHDVDSKAVTSTVTYADGIVKSNFYILSLTVDGVETFPSISQHSTLNASLRVGEGYRDAHVKEDLNKIYGNITGKTVTVKLSNGDTYTVNCDAGTVTKN